MKFFLLNMIDRYDLEKVSKKTWLLCFMAFKYNALIQFCDPVAGASIGAGGFFSLVRFKRTK